MLYLFREDCDGQERMLVDRVLDVHVECTATQTRVFGESCKTAETQIQTQHTTTCFLASRHRFCASIAGTEFVRRGVRAPYSTTEWHISTVLEDEENLF